MRFSRCQISRRLLHRRQRACLHPVQSPRGNRGRASCGKPRSAGHRLSWLSAAALNYETGRFRNFMSHGRQWLEEMGSEDSHARALWAVGTGAGRSRKEGHRRLCVQLFDRGLPAVAQFPHRVHGPLRCSAFMNTCARTRRNQRCSAARTLFTEKLVTLWKRCATEDWPWFETSATYDNARLARP